MSKRFAKRKIKIFDYVNCYRVFYIEDDGTKYFVGDYHTMNIDFIANDIKNRFKELTADDKSRV